MKRRTFVKSSTLTAVSIAAFGSLHWNGRSFEGNNATTTDILGPFYRPGAPVRSNLIPPGSTGEVLQVSGTIFQADGKTPMPNVTIEAWQCDEHEHYDNASDEYLFRGTIKPDKAGKYSFKTIVPVPYKNGEAWRPAHIHFRISSSDHQDLITQVYIKGDQYIEKDAWANAPEAVKRILEIQKNSSNENTMKFDVVMAKAYPLNDAGYQAITGLYALKDGMAEFIRQDDLLLLKLNGQYMEAMAYKGNNTFEGGAGVNQVKFEIAASGDVKCKLELWNRQKEGLKAFKYTN